MLSGKNELISGDAPGVVAAYVEQKLGAPVLFINGAAGDAAPIYSVYPDPKSGHLGQFRVLLGDRISQANSRIGPGTRDVTLRADQIYRGVTRLRRDSNGRRNLARIRRVGRSGKHDRAASRPIFLQ